MPQVICPDSRGHLLKGCDSRKEQSYFLYMLKSAQLKKQCFRWPDQGAGARHRPAASSPVSSKKDSTGICFIGERNFRAFITIPARATGHNAHLMGHSRQHIGLIHYTIGQRKGLALAAVTAAWYVVDKDM